MNPVELPVCETNGWSIFRQLAAFATEKRLDKADARTKFRIAISVVLVARTQCLDLSNIRKIGEAAGLNA